MSDEEWTGYRHAEFFISCLFDDIRLDRIVQFVGLKQGEPTRWRWLWDYERRQAALEEVLGWNEAGYAVFVGVNPRLTTAGGKRDNIACVGDIPVDLDTTKTGRTLESVLAILDEIDLHPTIIVHSGNGWHLHFVLEQSTTLERGEREGKRLAQMLGTDAVWNASRIMRLPGTVNWKNPPTLCYGWGVGKGGMWTIDDIEARLDASGFPFPEDRDIEIEAPAHAPREIVDALAALPDELREAVVTGAVPASWQGASGSGVDWRVCLGLVEAGLSDAEICAIYAAYPIQIHKAARAGIGYLERTIARAREQVAQSRAVEAKHAVLPCPPFVPVPGGGYRIQGISLQDYAHKVRDRCAADFDLWKRN